VNCFFFVVLLCNTFLVNPSIGALCASTSVGSKDTALRTITGPSQQYISASRGGYLLNKVPDGVKQLSPLFPEGCKFFTLKGAVKDELTFTLN
jgi:hypothetical protein